MVSRFSSVVHRTTDLLDCKDNVLPTELRFVVTCYDKLEILCFQELN